MRTTTTRVEKWDAAGLHIEALLHASNDLSRAREVFATEKKRPSTRALYAEARHPRSKSLAAGLNC